MEIPLHHVFKAAHQPPQVQDIILIHLWVNSSKGLAWVTAIVLILALVDMWQENVHDVAMKRNVIFACQGTYWLIIHVLPAQKVVLSAVMIMISMPQGAVIVIEACFYIEASQEVVLLKPNVEKPAVQKVLFPILILIILVTRILWLLMRIWRD